MWFDCRITAETRILERFNSTFRRVILLSPFCPGQKCCQQHFWPLPHFTRMIILLLSISVTARRGSRTNCWSSSALESRGDQRWRTFLRNHAAAIVACDFCVAVTARFRVLYIFVIFEHASRRLLHWNVTSNPTAAWTLQQLREAIAL